MSGPGRRSCSLNRSRPLGRGKCESAGLPSERDEPATWPWATLSRPSLASLAGVALRLPRAVSPLACKRSLEGGQHPRPSNRVAIRVERHPRIGLDDLPGANLRDGDEAIVQTLGPPARPVAIRARPLALVSRVRACATRSEPGASPSMISWAWIVEIGQAGVLRTGTRRIVATTSKSPSASYSVRTGTPRIETMLITAGSTRRFVARVREARWGLKRSMTWEDCDCSLPIPERRTRA